MICKLLTIILFLFVSFNNLYAQNDKNLEDIFKSASEKYNVPEDILKSIAYTETRFYNVIPSDEGESENGMPNAYGIVGLRNDNWFGHSLVNGANLINAPVNEVKVNVQLNIEAAAALLAKYADDLNINKNNLQEWRPVIEKYSGIPQDDVKPFYSFDVFKVLNEGTVTNNVVITQHAEINMSQFGEEVNPKNKLKNIEKMNSDQSIQSIDYPPAVWDPTQNFYNDDSFDQLFLVVHDTEGSFAGSVSWLKNPASDASAHYIIRSSDGYIIQLVREKYAAWHARCWNRVMLGVEHEGYVDNPAYFTEAMYQSSAALFRHFVETYGVPVDSFRIIGHYQHTKPWWVNWVNNTWNPNNPTHSFDPTCNSHTDPGPYWNWTHFFDLIKNGATAPKVVSASPDLDTVWNYTSIKINFDQAMTHQQTEDAFTITPNVTGAFTWENNGKTLVFTSSSPLNFSTNYSFSISTQALSVLNVNLDSSKSFSFYTKPDIPLNVIDVYPPANSTGISTTARILIDFNAPLIFSSLGGNVFFQDSSGNNVLYNNAKYEEINGSGIISFSPAQPLDYEKTYRIVLKTGIKSPTGNFLTDEFTSYFKTTKDNFVKGFTVDSFKTVNNWIGPSENENSVGIDTVLTTFSLSSSQSVFGNTSGRLDYTFISSDGMAAIDTKENIQLGTPDNNNKFGIWIYGDLSYNRVWFYFGNDESSAIILVEPDTITWTGWKYLEFPLAEAGLGGNIFLKRIVLRYSDSQTEYPIGNLSGTIYFDAIQVTDPITDIDDNNSTSVPSEYNLSQNYPNPFNPSTNIKFSIPKSEFVSLKVYNILGKEVAELVNERKPAGNYNIEFNADGLTSGVYFYRLQAGSFISTKKLILMK